VNLSGSSSGSTKLESGWRHSRDQLAPNERKRTEAMSKRRRSSKIGSPSHEMYHQRPHILQRILDAKYLMLFYNYLTELADSSVDSRPTQERKGALYIENFQEQECQEGDNLRFLRFIYLSTLLFLQRSTFDRRTVLARIKLDIQLSLVHAMLFFVESKPSIYFMVVFRILLYLCFTVSSLQFVLFSCNCGQSRFSTGTNYERTRSRISLCTCTIHLNWIL